MQNASEKSPADFPTHAMPILWLEVDDLAAAAELFARSGLAVTDYDVHLQIIDPDGLLVEVWQAQEAG